MGEQKGVEEIIAAIKAGKHYSLTLRINGSIEIATTYKSVWNSPHIPKIFKDPTNGAWVIKNGTPSASVIPLDTLARYPILQVTKETSDGLVHFKPEDFDNA